ncbi:hypothetical protein SDC9_64607 [bioreactor metagenome]|uniref:Uncharacterized protein n=1 Tax=bioreactor metagenome TaxID=1076179 RepID=A0A644XR04_9ZZZZ
MLGGLQVVRTVRADAHALEFFAALRRRCGEHFGGLPALRQEIKPFGHPVGARHHGGEQQQQREIALDRAHIPGADVAHEGCEDQRCQNLHGRMPSFP